MPTMRAPYFRNVADLAELPRNLEDAKKNVEIEAKDIDIENRVI